MPAMKKVEECEFRDRAVMYLSGRESIAVCRNGRIIGIYTPMQRDEEAVTQGWDQFGIAVDQLLRETGMTEEELADIFDLSKPFP